MISIIDVSAQILTEFGDLLSDYRKALYCSHHTTAGYFDQRLCDRLEHSPDRLNHFLQVFHRLFPPDSDYRHDRLELRTELTEEQKKTEPLNADSHLKFIGSGLRNCVTYDNRPGTPVYFVDLDGTYQDTARQRRTTVIGFDCEEVVARISLDLPVSKHPIDSLNLRDPRAIPGRTKEYASYDLVQVMNELLDTLGVSNSVLERLMARFLAYPASRFLRLKRSVSLLVSDSAGSGQGAIVQGTYQSPILVQWRRPATSTRRLRATLTRFR